MGGVVGVDYTEIQSYQNLTGVYLTPWGVETLFLLSAKYAEFVNKYREKKAPPPVQNNEDNEQHRLDRINNKIFR